MPTEDYNSEPVWYCANCYSLRIKHNDWLDEDYCDECGCSNLLTASIEEWENLYRGRYGKDHIKKIADPKKARLAKMSVTELKDLLWKTERWYSVICSLYKKFPRYNRVDTILLFFDKVIKEGRVEELREALYKYAK